MAFLNNKAVNPFGCDPRVQLTASLTASPIRPPSLIQFPQFLPQKRLLDSKTVFNAIGRIQHLNATN